MPRKTMRRPVGKSKSTSHVRGKVRNSRTINKKSVAEGFNTSAGLAAPAAEAPVEIPEPRPDGFPIVGVGASAGGLEAFTELLEALPSDTGMAFVLIQHLDLRDTLPRRDHKAAPPSLQDKNVED